MIALLQRVREASVVVAGETIAAIGPGLLVMIGVQPGDGAETVDRMARRLLGYRVFDDEEGRMNLSVTDMGGAVLLVPQFTLAADTRKGMRPGFSTAAPPDVGRAVFTELVTAVRSRWDRVAVGRFGADMDVHLVNQGPATFWLQS